MLLLVVGTVVRKRKKKKKKKKVEFTAESLFGGRDSRTIFALRQNPFVDGDRAKEQTRLVKKTVSETGEEKSRAK